MSYALGSTGAKLTSGRQQSHVLQIYIKGVAKPLSKSGMSY